MDADILAADQLTLEKIKAQDYRNSLVQQDAQRTIFNTAVQGFIDWLKIEYAKLPVESDPDARYRRDLILQLVAKYMTTSTSTVPATVLADAQADASRLKAALDEVLKL